MNVKRGILRLWLVFSALFAAVVCCLSYSKIRNEFRISHTDYEAIAKKYGGVEVVPVDCEEARGLPQLPSGLTLVTPEVKGVPAGLTAEQLTPDFSRKDGYCWYEMPAFRRLYPEYKDVSDGDLSEKLYAKVGQPLSHPHPWAIVGETAGIAVGWPLAVLALGWSLAWAFSGFRNPTPHKAP
jgi:hypothetical protein